MRSLSPPLQRPPRPYRRPGQIAATSEQLLTIDTQIYHIVLSNHGAVAQTWVLKKYKDHNGKPLDLANPASFTKVPPALSLGLKDDQEANALNFGLYVAKPDSDGLGVQYEFSDGVNYAKKSLRFTRNGYLTQITTEVTHNGAPVEHMIAWRGGFGDPSVLNRAAERHAVYYDLRAPSRFLGIQTGTGTLITKDAKSVKDGPYSTAGNFSFAGLDDKFFACVFLPKDNTSTKVEILKDDAPLAPGGKEEMQVGVEVGGDSVNRLTAFVGPKDVDLLRVVDPKLQQLIDWGWYGVIARPIFIAMHWLNDNVVHNYGWSIVIVTIAINLIAAAAALLQPEIAAQNAAAATADPGHQRQVQRPEHARSQEGPTEPGSDGAVQERGRESDGRVLAHADPAPAALRVLQSAGRHHRAARRALAVGDGSVAAGTAAPSTCCRSS